MIKRPRALVVILAGLLFLAFVARFFYGYVGIDEVPDVGEPFDVHAFESTSVAADKNAFTLYRQAQAQFVDLKAIVKDNPLRLEAAKKDQDDVLRKGWAAASEDVRQYLAANRKALETWKRGTERADALEVPLDQVSLESDFSAGQTIRNLVLLALIEAERLNAVNRPQEAWAWHRASLRASRHVGMHAVTIQRLIGVATYQATLGPVLRWSARPDLKAADLRQALADVESMNRMTPPFSETLKVEYLWMAHEARNFVGAPGARTSANAGKPAGFFDRVRRLMNLMFANWLSQADVPRYQRVKLEFDAPELYAIDPADRSDPKLRDPADIERWFALPKRKVPALVAFLRGPSYVLSVAFFTLTIPATGAYHEAIDREGVDRGALVLGLALETYRREHGQFPATLKDLVRAGDLKMLPTDPFAKGEPLRYRREASPHEAALVWSVWYDEVDQGGKEASESDQLGPGDKSFHIVDPQTPATSGGPRRH
jgi:hypothetical protein